MSKFAELDDGVLAQIAEEFGVDFDGRWGHSKKVSAIENDGVTWEMYKQSFPDLDDIPDEEGDVVNEVVSDAPVKKEKSPVRPQPTVLLRMERANPTYQTRGYTFTKDHPFLPVSQEAAEWIIRNEEGFRVALPSEAEEFYS